MNPTTTRPDTTCACGRELTPHPMGGTTCIPCYLFDRDHTVCDMCKQTPPADDSADTLREMVDFPGVVAPDGTYRAPWICYSCVPLPTSVLFMGVRHKVCSPECAYLYQERCPDRAHVSEGDEA